MITNTVFSLGFLFRFEKLSLLDIGSTAEIPVSDNQRKLI